MLYDGMLERKYFKNFYDGEKSRTIITRRALSNEMHIYYETIILRMLLNIFTEE